MKVIFEDDKYFYYISDYNTINRGLIVSLSDYGDLSDIDFSNIPHLDDAEVLYHYRDINSDQLYPVYYDYRNHFITKDERYYIRTMSDNLTKDYTLINLKLLEDGSSI